MTLENNDVRLGSRLYLSLYFITFIIPVEVWLLLIVELDEFFLLGGEFHERVNNKCSKYSILAIGCNLFTHMQ